MRPGRQAAVDREINATRRTALPNKEQFVWGVYNSSDPIFTENPYAIELLLFASKKTALEFVRELLKNQFDVETAGLSDDAVEDLMWDNDTDRYLHLYELRVHDDEYCTISLPLDENMGRR